MAAPDADAGDDKARDPYARRKLERHEEAHQQFDRRISRNENYRIQMQGALKILALLVSSGVVGYLLAIAGII